MDSIMECSSSFEQKGKLLSIEKNFSKQEILYRIEQTGDDNFTYDVINFFSDEYILIKKNDLIQEELFTTILETRKEVDLMLCSNKITKFYSKVIKSLSGLILFFACLIAIPAISIPKEITVSAVIFLSIALISFLVDKSEYIKKCSNGK